jgi:hypothetical protein
MWRQRVEEKSILAHSSICFGVIHSGSRRPRPLAVEECAMCDRNVAPRGVGQGTTGFARGAPFSKKGYVAPGYQKNLNSTPKEK